jgi:hypothetical protein
MSAVGELLSPSPARRSAAVRRPMLQRPVRRVALHRARTLESLAVFAVFAAGFGALGCWLVLDRGVVTFDALGRLTGAFLVWHNDPPKLAAALPCLHYRRLRCFRSRRYGRWQRRWSPCRCARRCSVA